MESSGLPMLHYLLQQTLKSLCSCPADASNSSSSSSSCSFPKWVYAVFWRILPRNFPPPKWEYGGGSTLDRSKGNKRNWILVWEDGFCDFQECQLQACKFGPDVFFKMAHEVYSYGEGIIGKVAADNSHKWVFRQSGRENDSTIISWNVFIDPQPKTWQSQFNSGIQTIALISVREGVIQLGSLNKVEEDLNLVINIQRKLSSLLQNVPGVLSIQRPLSPMAMTQQQSSFHANHMNMNPHYYYYSNETTATSSSSSSFLNEGVKPPPLQFPGLKLKRSLYSQAGAGAGGGGGGLEHEMRVNFGAFLSKIPSSNSPAAPNSPTGNCSNIIGTTAAAAMSPSSLLESDHIIRQQQQQQLTRSDPCGGTGSAGGFISSPPPHSTIANAVKLDPITSSRDDKITSPHWFVGVGGIRMLCNDNTINAQM
ncbi:hypothetical protein Dimus_028017 [Dionaea muscipula]